ncbi:MAG: lactonase family protein [Planctomycetales bacterium]
MKMSGILVLVAAMTVSISPAAYSGQILYLASTKAKTVVAYEVHSETGALTKKDTVDLPGNAGPMAFSPDKSFVYAAVTGLADKKAGVVTLARGKDGSLSLRKTAFIMNRAPYIRANKDGSVLLAAHYGPGDVTTYRIEDGICTGELLDHKVTDKTAHCIEIDPSGKFVFVPHTAPNKIYQFRLNSKSGKLTPNDPPFVDGPDEDHLYHQPRHYAHHQTLKMAFTSNERGGGISAWKFDPKSGRLTLKQTLSTLPPNFEGNSAAADINITPDGRFVYVSNRDVTKRDNADDARDTLAGFSIDPQTGDMKLIGYFPTARFPRAFCIDLTGKFLYAAGQNSANLFAYSINQQTGSLKHSGTYETGGAPIWVMCGEVGE